MQGNRRCSGGIGYLPDPLYHAQGAIFTQQGAQVPFFVTPLRALIRATSLLLLLQYRNSPQFTTVFQYLTGNSEAVVDVPI